MMLRLRRVAALTAVIAICEAAGTIQLFWTTDPAMVSDWGMLGPDGPWQAVVANIGNETEDYPDGAPGAFWPSGSSGTQVLASKAGGNYSIDNSSTAVKVGSSSGLADSWLSNIFVNESGSGVDATDLINMDTKSGESFQTNATVYALDEWEVEYPGGQHYTVQVGTLGLGPFRDSFIDGLPNPPTILPQLKADGKVASEFFSVHMGSAALGQPGSLVLGGYEQNRAIGPVGTFPMPNGETPMGFLVDVTLGVQTGESPFGFSGSRSVWQGLGGNEEAEKVTSSLGGKLGSAVVMPNPAVPYIYLPLDTCDAAAYHLPMTWNEGLMLYTWNVDDPQFSRIVGSPAYLGFVLADVEATNITIKVPLRLLNLTLEPPIVEKPTQYFPCMSFNSSYGFWQLGRAFLQAAFLAVNFEQNVSYIAQAPGPDMDQSVLRTFQPSDTSISSNSIDSFERSWTPLWTALAAAESNSAAQPGGDDRLSSGGIAGIVVGSAAAVVATALMAFFLWRRRRRSPVELAAQSQKHPGLETTEQPGDAYAAPMQELGEGGVIFETGKPLQHEMEVPQVAHEPLSQEIYEMPVPSPGSRINGR